MANTCDVCGKRRLSGHTVSHSNNKTKRVFNPNLQRVRALIPGWAMGSASATTREEVAHLVALRLGVDPTTDIRPYVFVDSAVATANAAHDFWLAGGCDGDVVTVAAEALDMLEIGFGAVSAEVRRHGSWQARSV